MNQEGTRLDHSKDNADGSTDSLGRRATQYILRNVQAINSCIQRGEDFVLTFRSLGI